jgi:pimeloyl-ACP methyl ester carboxylesterase
MIKTNHTLVASAIVATMLTACGDSKTVKTDASVTEPAKSFKSVECKKMLPSKKSALLTPGSTCGYLTVPEKYELYGQPASKKTIEIAVIKLASTSSDKKSDPVVYLQGGPGGNASASIGEVVSSKTFIKDRDVYLVDQRGTGYSKPALFCTEYNGEIGTPKQVKACNERLKKTGVDLNAFHSVHSAKDFIALREALDIPQWNLYGISYGTRLATTIMRENSKGIRSVILDGMFPIEVNGMSDIPWANYETLNQIITNCKHSTGCPAVQLKETIEDIILRMHNADMVAESRVFIQNLLELAKNPLILKYILAINNDISLYASEMKTIEGEGEQGDDEDIFYSAMALSTICAEEYPFLNTTALTGRNDQGWSATTQLSVTGMYHMGFDKASCKIWGVAPANEIEVEPVTSNLPVLILNGQNDSQTPAAWGKLVAKNMPNAQNITNPQGGHGQLFSDFSCVKTITDNFLSAPNQEINKDCVSVIPNVTYQGGNSKLDQVFSKNTSVFGIPIYGTVKTPDEAILHAANVMAQYLDNDEDGKPNNQRVVEQLIKKGAALIMGEDSSDLEQASAELTHSDSYQDLYASEVVSDGTKGKFDATLEEVLHLITHVGYANVYPEVFGEQTGSTIAKAMDVARGGHFKTIPASYPAGAWYTYNDQSCNYDCMITEYTYWSLTSILGAQKFDSRLNEIVNEWKLNTLEKVKNQDPTVYQILTERQYGLATRLPDGHYSAEIFKINR